MSFENVFIEKNISSGEGMGRIGGKVVFVPYAIEGETVEVKITESFSDYDRAQIVSYKKKISDSQKVKCPYFFTCGGCSFQHVERDLEISIKEKTAHEIMKKMKLNFPIENKLSFSHRRYQYRCRLSLSVPKKDVKLGFYRRKTEDFLPVDKCLLAEDRINGKFNDALSLSLCAKNLGYYPSSVSINSYDDGIAAVLRITEQRGANNLNQCDDAGFSSVYLTGEKSDRTEHALGKKRMKISFDQDQYVSCSSFVQVNRETTGLILEYIKENIRESEWLVDLYCGSGFFSFQLENYAKKIIGVDSNETAIMDAVYNAYEKGLEKARFFNIQDREVGRDLLRKDATLVVDPPRTGINQKLLKTIIEKNIRDIFYLSCNLPSMARDLQVFSQNGYKVEKLALFDMFPLTPHVEAIALIKTD
ncbi:class I SAM-dependent RNA methyltransferase [candidate division WOR-3 bacterium]|nr:class I SAM-dependent RNA methyltransferase [candidate division WOR-3 bacterium]